MRLTHRGFRYVVHAGTAGAGGRAEWFEVTEVFEGVKAKDVEAFMRIRNGLPARRAFDPTAFANRLDLGTPGRAAQRRAADQVIAAVGKKLAKVSYRDMRKSHGFGTLIVGLPLWFATYPADPHRAENVIDDFVTRVAIGLKPHFRQLRSRRCPFWRIVVVWQITAQSMREWTCRARFDVYDDPAYRSFSALPAKLGSLMPVLLDMTPGGLTQRIAGARSEKRGKQVELSPRMAPLLRALDDMATRLRLRFHQRIKWSILQRCLELVCFVRIYGLAGLERWMIVRLSPRRWTARLATRRRAQRLYRTSRRPGEARRRARDRRRRTRSRR